MGTFEAITIRDENTTTTARVESNGGLAVNLQDQTSTVVDVYMHDHGNPITISGTPAVDDIAITLVGGHGVVAGNFIGFKEDSHFFESQVINVATNVITLDQPLDYAFTSAASPSHVHDPNMNVDGSSTTAIYHVTPPAGQIWDITRLIFVIEDDSAMDTAKFGGMNALTNGVVLRMHNGIIKNIFNVKTNGELASRSYDLVYDDKAPAGVFGLRCRTTFAGQSKRGVTIRLYGDSGDELQLLIQDNLTDLLFFRAIVQGHVVVE